MHARRTATLQMRSLGPRLLLRPMTLWTCLAGLGARLPRARPHIHAPPPQSRAPRSCKFQYSYVLRNASNSLGMTHGVAPRSSRDPPRHPVTPDNFPMADRPCASEQLSNQKSCFEIGCRWDLGSGRPPRAMGEPAETSDGDRLERFQNSPAFPRLVCQRCQGSLPLRCCSSLMGSPMLYALDCPFCPPLRRRISAHSPFSVHLLAGTPHLPHQWHSRLNGPLPAPSLPFFVQSLVSTRLIPPKLSKALPFFFLFL